jgi:hypothetical protein
LKKVMLAALVIVALICATTGISAAYTSGSGPAYDPFTTKYPNDFRESNITFNFEQSVQGNGYFMAYKYAKAGNLEFKDYEHGSGSLDSDVVLFTQELASTTYGYDINEFNQSCISYKADNTMTYAPMRIAIGTGYYAARPLAYDSLLKEKTWVKNRRSTTMMHHEIEYAHAIDKEIEVLAKEKYNYTHDPEWLGVGATQMKINEDVTDGKIHIGVLQGENAPVADPIVPTVGSAGASMITAWKNPAIEIDEDYFGTYHIEKNMTLEVPYKRIQKGEDWLPCCSGGWTTMNAWDQKGHGASTRGIFDCSCYKVPAVAEFQRVY